MSAKASFSTVLLDVDGTLVDSNDAHAHAWVEAFEEHGVPVAFADVRRCIGMGGDKLMPEVSGIADDSPQGKRIAKSRGEIFMRVFLPEIKPLRQSEELVTALKARGLTAVAASSAQRKELTQLLKIAGAAGLLNDSTSSDDAEESKPAPDIIEAALKKAGAAPDDTVMVGDTPYDIAAATRAGVRTIAFRSGGWADEDLRGAIAIYDGPWDLLTHIEEVFG